ncbi:hypothetical protein FHS29_007309 [Saccharothrix tamanrassetensis]|uniref:DUF6745 domain-containing protein n=1 Tax=Saccharothrix tamanrassetensis TaxID=1051531 RepID=A0A841CSC6_9PSEU|nr:hypothetical protein [Saccharothrix tamanrassetensis]MBB5960681.1 hypothetical protein [Saccharothrix tamanrassetensis]
MTWADELTDGDIALISATVDDWLRVGRSVERCDRAAAEAAVAAAYVATGLTPPRLVVWMDSPLGGLLAAYAIRRRVAPAELGRLVVVEPSAGVLDRVAGMLGEQVPGLLAEPPAVGSAVDLGQARRQVFDPCHRTGSVQEPLWSPLWPRLRYLLEERPGGPVGDPPGTADDCRAVDLWDELGELLAPLRNELGGALGSRVARQLRQHLQRPLPGAIGAPSADGSTDVRRMAPHPDPVRFWSTFGGQLDPWGDAYFLALFGCALRVAGLPVPPRLDALIAAMRSLGWWWPMADAVVLTDRPTGIHPEGGQWSLTYADGFRA